MVVAAFDFECNEVWRVEPGEFASMHGDCSSPGLFDDTVIVNGDHDGDGYIVALDRATGETRWKIDRPNNTRSYCTPIIREIDGRTQMVLSGSKCVTSYDPRDGSLNWIIDGPTEQYVASLVYNGRFLFLTAGFSRSGRIFWSHPTTASPVALRRKAASVCGKCVWASTTAAAPCSLADWFISLRTTA
jgi:outer membrane protein assembly factor BamB